MWVLILEAHQDIGVLILEGHGVGNTSTVMQRRRLRQCHKRWANNVIHGALDVGSANGERYGGTRLRLMKLGNVSDVVVAASGARGCRHKVVGLRIQSLSNELLLDTRVPKVLHLIVSPTR